MSLPFSILAATQSVQRRLFALHCSTFIGTFRTPSVSFFCFSCSYGGLAQKTCFAVHKTYGDGIQ